MKYIVNTLSSNGILSFNGFDWCEDAEVAETITEAIELFRKSVNKVDGLNFDSEGTPSVDLVLVTEDVFEDGSTDEAREVIASVRIGLAYDTDAELETAVNALS